MAYQQGMRALSQQVEQWEQVRARASTLISTAALSASLLGGFAISSRTTDLDGWGIAALAIAGAGLVWITVVVVAIWWPAEGTFSLSPATIIQQWADTLPTATASQLHRDLALYMSLHQESNGWKLDRRLRWFSSALVAFLVEISMLGAVLWNVTR
jgi:hypothetical protein